ncbi:MAG: DUF368 domain-containing protein [Bacteroidota bacterium]
MGTTKNEKRTIIGYLMIMFRGMGMGAADVVPGVSGGTIAFITGIYEELIGSLSKINLQALRVLSKEGIRSFWKYINGNFFVALFLGIGISVLSLAKLLVYLLDTYPVLLWSFFFGLVLSSAIFVLRSMTRWNFYAILAIIVGTAAAAIISSLQSTADGGAHWYIVVSGAIAICAMILPGISGAFILVLLGSYHTIIGGIKDLDLVIVGLFALGCLIGLLAFSRLLNYLFAHFKNLVLALLAGFLFGSLWKIWPWKERVGESPLIIHSDGREVWMDQNVWPEMAGYGEIWGAAALALAGFLLVLVVERFGAKK